MPWAPIVLQLRQLLLVRKAGARKAAETREDRSLEIAREIAFALVDAANDKATSSTLPESEPSTPAPPPPPSPDTASSGTPPRTFTFDPHLMKLVERINDEKDRAHIKEDTRKQLIAQARLFICATGVSDVAQITQVHLKVNKSVLQRLPRSYGKSSKDADRSVEELIARGDSLPEDQIGLSPATVNGHLDRFALIFRDARSKSLKFRTTSS